MSTAIYPVTTTLPEPVSLALFKLWGRFDVGADPRDPVMESLITGARERVELVCERLVRPASWRADLDAFPAEREFVISGLGPISVSSITYTDALSVPQILPSSAYVVGHSHCGAFVALATDDAWPAGASNVVINFNVGFPVVPQSICHAIQMHALHLLDNPALQEREEKAFMALLAPYRLLSI